MCLHIQNTKNPKIKKNQNTSNERKYHKSRNVMIVKIPHIEDEDRHVDIKKICLMQVTMMVAVNYRWGGYYYVHT